MAEDHRAARVAETLLHTFGYTPALSKSVEVPQVVRPPADGTRWLTQMQHGAVDGKPDRWPGWRHVQQVAGGATRHRAAPTWSTGSG
jgi:hypothetical protein